MQNPKISRVIHAFVNCFVGASHGGSPAREASPSASPNTFTPSGDSWTDLLQAHTGRPASPPRTSGDFRPLEPTKAHWAHPDVSLLSADNELYLQCAFLLGKGGCGAVRLGVAVATGELMAIKCTDQMHRNAQMAKHVGMYLAQTGSTLAPYRILETERFVYFIESLKTHDMHKLDAQLTPHVRRGLAVLVSDHVIPELLALHAQGIAHCDIKPSNIMQRSTTLHLIDFDFVRGIHIHGKHATPYFGAPEDFGHFPHAGLDKVDTWAMGVTLWSVACGTDASSVLGAHDGRFGDATWRDIFINIYPALLAGRMPPEGLRIHELHVWRGFENLAPHTRKVILGLMHPEPTRRLKLGVAMALLRTPEVLGECHIDHARAYLRDRASGRAESFAPTIAQAEKTLRALEPTIAQELGEVPAWLAGPSPRQER